MDRVDHEEAAIGRRAPWRWLHPGKQLHLRAGRSGPVLVFLSQSASDKANRRGLRTSKRWRAISRAAAKLRGASWTAPVLWRFRRDEALARVSRPATGFRGLCAFSEALISKRRFSHSSSPHISYFRMSKAHLDQPPTAHQGQFAAICGLDAKPRLNRETVQGGNSLSSRQTATPGYHALDVSFRRARFCWSPEISRARHAG